MWHPAVTYGYSNYHPIPHRKSYGLLEYKSLTTFGIYKDPHPFRQGKLFIEIIFTFEIMTYNQDDQLAINTIRLLAVSHNPANVRRGSPVSYSQDYSLLLNISS